MTDPVRVILVTADGSIGRRADLAPSARVEVVRWVRRVEDLPGAVDEVAPGVVVIDTALDDDKAFETIEETIGRTPRVKLLALTPEPVPTTMRSAPWLPAHSASSTSTSTTTRSATLFEPSPPAIPTSRQTPPARCWPIGPTTSG